MSYPFVCVLVGKGIIEKLRKFKLNWLDCIIIHSLIREKVYHARLAGSKIMPTDILLLDKDDLHTLLTGAGNLELAGVAIERLVQILDLESKHLQNYTKVG